MLPNINLDDKSFDELVIEALEELHRYNGEWTDQNLHDPGITFIELFAWLSEMQRYYLNRVSDQSKESIFKLLGIEKEQKQLAQSKIVLSNLKQDIFMPKGMKFKAGDLVFESLNQQWILSNTLKQIHVEVDKKISDKTRENTYQEIYFYPFGEDVRKDNKLYLGFKNPFPVNKAIDITFLNKMSEQTRAGDDIDSNMFLVNLSWEVYGGNGNWEPVEIVYDHTLGLSLTGKLRFMVLHEMTDRKISENTDSAFWLRAVVQQDYNEIPHRQDNIRLNMVEVEHTNQRVSCCDIVLRDEKTTYYLNDYLQLFGDNYIQVYIGDGYWKDVNKLHHNDLVLDFSLASDTADFRIDRVKQQLILLQKLQLYNKVRVLSYTKKFLENTFIGPSLGLSNQVFELYMPSIVYNSIRLQVGEYIDDELCWIEWIEVDTFDFSSPTDLNFKVNYELSQLIFGDNIHGRIPESGDDNIRLISLSVGGGVSGNIREHEINSFYCNADAFHEIYKDNNFNEITISNPVSAVGGKDMEDVKDLHRRLLKDLNQPYVAVTPKDYKTILKDIPRLEIERTHIISNYDKDNNEVAYGHITIVVMPKSDVLLPIPTDNFRHAVKQYLEPSRLITTQLHIIGPCYVKIDVNVIVFISKSTILKTQAIKDVLDNLLNPRSLGKEEGWLFGAAVKKSIVYRALSSIEGVKRIEGLSLHSIHRDSKMKSNGDIYISEYCVPFSGEHNIDIVVS